MVFPFKGSGWGWFFEDSVLFRGVLSVLRCVCMDGCKGGLKSVLGRGWEVKGRTLISVWGCYSSLLPVRKLLGSHTPLSFKLNYLKAHSVRIAI